MLAESLVNFVPGKMLDFLRLGRLHRSQSDLPRGGRDDLDGLFGKLTTGHT